MPKTQPMKSKHTQLWRDWTQQLKSFAMTEAEMIPDLTEDYWRSCYDSGMSPEQAFRESFTEQDGI